MPRVLLIAVHEKALRKKAALWLLWLGLAAAFFAAPVVAPECSTNSPIIQRIIADRIADYRATTGGNCPCPYHTASDGSTCGGRSAWSRSGGADPLCYPTDV